MRGERGLGHAELDSVLDKVTYDIKQYRKVQYNEHNMHHKIIKMIHNVMKLCYDI